MGQRIIRLLILLVLWSQVQAHTSGVCYDTKLQQFYFLTYHSLSSWEGMNCKLLVMTSPEGSVTSYNFVAGTDTSVAVADPGFPNKYPDVCLNISASAIPVLTDKETEDTSNVESYGILPAKLSTNGWYNFSSPATPREQCGSGPTFASVPDWRLYYYVTPTQTATPTPTPIIIPVVPLGLGGLALLSDETRAWFAANNFSSTSTIVEGGRTITYVLVSSLSRSGFSVPMPDAAAECKLHVTSFGPGVTKAVIQAYGPNAWSADNLQLENASSALPGTPVCLFQVDRMDDVGKLMNDQPFSFTVASNGNSLLDVTSFSSLGGTAENVVDAGGKVTLSADKMSFDVSATHTSAFAAVYLTPSTTWAWWLLLLLLLVPLSGIVWWWHRRQPLIVIQEEVYEPSMEYFAHHALHASPNVTPLAVI